jgi:succinate dehydrogenase / fumarate reductase iron-sulfur subunit
MKFHLKVWRQKDSNSGGTLEDYTAENIPADASFLEMLDIVNNNLTGKDVPPIQFDSDCREGICGSCSHRDQRHTPRPRSRHDLPTLHAQFPRR